MRICAYNIKNLHNNVLVFSWRWRFIAISATAWTQQRFMRLPRGTPSIRSRALRRVPGTRQNITQLNSSIISLGYLKHAHDGCCAHSHSYMMRIVECVWWTVYVNGFGRPVEQKTRAKSQQLYGTNISINNFVTYLLPMILFYLLKAVCFWWLKNTVKTMCLTSRNDWKNC